MKMKSLFSELSVRNKSAPAMPSVQVPKLHQADFSGLGLKRETVEYPKIFDDNRRDSHGFDLDYYLEGYDYMYPIVIKWL
jgi:hypothetical protein